jgi:hypothetical protein
MTAPFSESDARSVGAPLELPCSFEGILNSAGVAPVEVGDNHHVLDVPGRDAEGAGKLAQYQVAVFEVGPDHQANVIKLARNQPAVVPPLGQPVRRRAAHARHGRGQAGYLVDLH